MKRLIVILLAAVCVSSAAEAQNFVQGKVTDRAWEPIPGARVSSTKKHGASTLTDIDGRFILDERPRRIKAEFGGYKTKIVGKTKYSPVSIRLRREKKIHYQGEFSIAYVTSGSMSGYQSEYCEGIWDQSSITLETIHGVRFGKYFFMGWGFNLDVFTKESGMMYTPLMNVKGYLPIFRDFAVYVSVDAGITINDWYGWYDREYNDYGLWQRNDGYYDETWIGTPTEYNYYHYKPESALHLKYGVGLNYRHLNFAVGIRHLKFYRDEDAYYRYNYGYYKNVPDMPKLSNIGVYFKLGLKW